MQEVQTHVTYQTKGAYILLNLLLKLPGCRDSEYSLVRTRPIVRLSMDLEEIITIPKHELVQRL